MSYGPILLTIAVRTFEYTVENYAVDHYAAAGGDDRQAAFAGRVANPRATEASERLLREVGLSQGRREFPVIRRTGNGVFSPKLTRVVIWTAEDALLLVAFEGWVADRVARALADQIANALWRRQRYSVMFPDPSHYIGPQNIDGLGTPIPTFSSIGHLLNRRR